MSLDLNGANYLALTGEIEGRVSVLEVAEEHGLRERLNLIDNIKMFRLERDGNDWRVMVPHGHPRQRRRNRGGHVPPRFRNCSFSLKFEMLPTSLTQDLEHGT